MKRSILAVSLALVCLSACEKQTTENIQLDLGYDFFPLQVGKYWEYQVDSILFVPDVSGTRLDSSRTWIREEIITQRLNNAGDTIYQAERYERKDTTHPWQIRRVFILQRTNNQALREEDNLRLIKLIFPLRSGQRWNSLRFIDPTLRQEVAGQSMAIFKDWETRTEAVSEPFAGQYANYQTVTTIQYADHRLLTELRVVQERYAKGIGLVERTWEIMDTQCTTCCGSLGDVRCQTLPWKEKAERGFVLKQQLIAHN
jgi:hypothetical protein